MDSPGAAADLDSLLLAIGEDPSADDGGPARPEQGPDNACNLSKVVLARQLHLTVQGHLHALALLDVLQQRDARSYQVALTLPDGSAFVASTPERLYARQGRHVISEAVAGAKCPCRCSIRRPRADAARWPVA